MESRITGQELIDLQKQVKSFNTQLKQQQPRSTGEELDKDAFLQLLTIQISRQDPLSPMQNTEFVAQMAQFTALEQMKNMNTAMERLEDNFSVLPMFSMIGKEVTHYSEASESYITGEVEGVYLGKGEEPMLVVDGEQISSDNIVSIQEQKQTRLTQGLAAQAAYLNQLKTDMQPPASSLAPAAPATPTPANTTPDSSSTAETATETEPLDTLPAKEPVSTKP